ncbi:MAG: 5'/3'-nucleotidase SurE [Candidatus Marinarcus sp.]|uniref:5'/3'-nucleotidase SurE n=1 Tax=Candidatus Marinarcus sp. TaxID=3100987 RepID=UPI003B002118
MKHILITNDDGYESAGLKALAEALSPLGKITVVAPATEKSACGHSLTLTRPLRLVNVDDDFYKVDDGTPTDCVFVSLNNLFKEDKKPDLVVSGINIGSNMGEDITYSGTASAAMEAVLQGVPAIAISQVCNDHNTINNGWDFALAKKSIHDIVKKILEGSFPLDKRKFLNINIPQTSIEECKGMRISKVGYREYGNDTQRHVNPRGEEYYWIGIHPLIWKKSEDSSCDFETIKENYVSITPIHLDMTSHNDIDILKEWLN